MNRLLALTVISSVVISTAGCNCCGNLFNRNRNTCAFNSTPSVPPGCSACGDGQMVGGDGMVSFDSGLLPPPTTTLPGPQR